MGCLSFGTVLAMDRSDEDAIILALARDADLESGKVSPLSHAELMTRLRDVSL